jgi:hypothetical protein
MEDRVLVQYRFDIERDGIILQDALYFTLEEFDTISQETIEATKEERYAAHVENLKNLQAEAEKEAKRLSEIEVLEADTIQ